MKKVLAVLMAVSIVFALSGCASKEYKDTAVTIPVTDENGKEVTDKNGKVVTELSTTAKEEKKDNENKKEEKESTLSKEKKKEKKDNKNTTKSNKNKTTKKATTTTKKVTTTKPKKRDILLRVEVPFYNDQETEITVRYRAKGDKKYKTLEIKDNKIVLDKSPLVLNYKIKDVKDYVDIVVTLKGIDVTYNRVRVKAEEKTATIKLVTGIEVLEPEGI